jgi:hypothetical protein
MSAESINLDLVVRVDGRKVGTVRLADDGKTWEANAGHNWCEYHRYLQDALTALLEKKGIIETGIRCIM